MNRTTSLLHAAVAALLMASPAFAADAPKPGEKPAELLQPAKPFEALQPPQPTNIQWTKTVLSKEFFSEGAAAGDFNKDGKMDVASGPYWYEGPDFSPEKRHAFYEPKVFNPLQYSDNFLAYAHDFNGDGWDDILVYGFPGKEAWIFENPKTPAGQKQGPWKRHTALASVDNESPGFADINGDGKPDIICSTGGFLGYATADWNNPFQPWTFHKISPKGPWQRFTHGLGVGDVNGDGKMDLLEKDGWWEQPADLAGDPVWKKHDAKFGNGGAQMYAYDVNGDGKNDVITSIAAHGYGLAWFEQSGDGTFTPHLIMGQKPEENVQRMKISQLHAIDLVDIDGDGLKDIVTGKRWWAHGPKGDAEPDAAAVLTWFRLVREGGKARFDGHVIDTDSGIGTQVMAIDLNGDKKPDIVVGNKRGTFVHIQSTKPAATARRD